MRVLKTRKYSSTHKKNSQKSSRAAPGWREGRQGRGGERTETGPQPMLQLHLHPSFLHFHRLPRTYSSGAERPWRPAQGPKISPHASLRPHSPERRLLGGGVSGGHRCQGGGPSRLGQHLASSQENFLEGKSAPA